ncbi:MAG: EamA family transporter [Gemmataceae bacterium]
MMASPHIHQPPHPWAIVVAFVALYISWGTTYLAIKHGVQTEGLPPAFFGGTRVALAGLLLLAFLWMRRASLALSGSEWITVTIGGVLFFVGGNGLLTFAEVYIPSGYASVLGATTTLFIGLLEFCWPGGDRLTGRGWLGMGVGFAGVCLLVGINPETEKTQAETLLGAGLMLSCCFCWALGSVLIRRMRRVSSHWVSAGYQMLIGGTLLTLLGFPLGEWNSLPSEITTGAVISFVYLLVVGSFIGFLAFHYLLGHVPASLVGTHAYVNPLVAVWLGWFLASEEITLWTIYGMVAVLGGVAVVRGANSTKVSQKGGQSGLETSTSLRNQPEQ